MRTIKISFILLIVFEGLHCFGQQGQWAWMNGNNTNYVAVFGTKGIPGPNNTPPGLYEACEWTDLQGNFWLFGGLGVNNNERNDLWKFNPVTNQWTWMNGNGNNTASYYGVYGSRGVPSVNNYPGARAWGVITWTDNAGDLWLFGGSGYGANGFKGRLNDFWRYHIATNEWTWMSGSQSILSSGVFGLKGVPDINNAPYCRDETSCSWVTDDYLWLFGGFSQDSTCTINGLRNDLWRYKVSTNEWTWMNGSDSIDVIPHYGILGMPDSSNNPGGRMVYSRWKDNCGNLWLFGGNYYYGNANDVWKYNINSNLWSWESGTNIPNDIGYSNGPCNSSVNNRPSARAENRACWSDKCGNLWTFGYPNDLWHFNVSTREWTFINGTANAQHPQVLGTKTVAGPFNHPSIRSGAPAWKDLNGNLWLFGGTLTVGFYVNDLWRYIPDTTCPNINCENLIPTISNDTTICLGDSVVITAGGGTNYLWNNGDTTQSIKVSPQYSALYTVFINKAGSCTVTKFVTINVSNSQFNFLGNDTSLCAGQTFKLNASIPNSTYLWQNGSHDSTIVVNQSGTYWANVCTNGCHNIDSVIVLFNQLPNINLGNDTSVCFGNNLILKASISNATYLWQNLSTDSVFNVNQQGVYWVKVTSSGCSNSDTINIYYHTIPIISLGNDTVICQGTNIILDVTYPNASYLWQDNSISPTYNVTYQGLYWVKQQLIVVVV